METENKILNIRPPLWGLVLATLLAVAATVYLGVLTRNALQQYNFIGRSSQQIYTITISGEGKVQSRPDIAQVQLGIETDRSTVGAAQTENTTKMNALIAELKALAIASDDIATTNYTVYPNYDYTEGRQILRGYRVSQVVTVKIRNLDLVGNVIEAAGSLGSNQIGGLSFTIDEPEALRQQAREKALINAKQKADALAQVVGAKLGKLVSFSENEFTPSPYKEYAYGLGMGGDVAQKLVPEIEPGSQEITVFVTVTYEVL